MIAHTITVTTTVAGLLPEHRTINARYSLNTWTRKDGGVTVRVDHARTIRFDGKSAPVIKRHK